MYYRYDENYVLIEKSSEPLEGDNTATYWEDIDLDLFKVTIGAIVDGVIVKVTKKVNNAEALSRRLKEIDEHQAEAEIDIDFRLSLLELGLI